MTKKRKPTPPPGLERLPQHRGKALWCVGNVQGDWAPLTSGLNSWGAHGWELVVIETQSTWFPNAYTADHHLRCTFRAGEPPTPQRWEYRIVTWKPPEGAPPLVNQGRWELVVNKAPTRVPHTWVVYKSETVQVPHSNALLRAANQTEPHIRHWDETKRGVALARSMVAVFKRPVAE
jgi:hypothetical protein